MSTLTSMRRVGFLLGLVIPLFCFIEVAVGQKIQVMNVIDLQKFSYLIYGSNHGYNYTATCFFIRSGGRLFLIGAGHTFDGQNPVTGVNDPDVPDELTLVICKDCAVHLDTLKINTRSHRASSTRPTFTEKPEVFIREMNDPRLQHVNSVEMYMKKFDPAEMNLINEVVMFGFPSPQVANTDELIYLKPSKCSGHVLEKYSELHFWLELQKHDTVNYLMKPADESLMGGGFSGSPCFFTIAGKMYFGGVNIAGSMNKRLNINVRPEKIWKLLKSVRH